MYKNVYDVFVNLSSNKISFATFKDLQSKSISFKEYNWIVDFNDDQFNYKDAKKIIEELIFETEKTTETFLNEIFLMEDLSESKK